MGAMTEALTRIQHTCELYNITLGVVVSADNVEMMISKGEKANHRIFTKNELHQTRCAMIDIWFDAAYRELCNLEETP